MSLKKRTDSEVWWLDITWAGGRLRESTGEYDRKAAQRVHDKRKAALHDTPILKGLKWSDAVMKWARAETRSDSDLLSLVNFSRHFKDRLLSSVTAESIDQALQKFCTTDGTYNRYATRVAAILKMSGSPTKVIRRKDKDAKARDWLTHKQWAKLSAELPPHMLGMATFAVTTGLRQANVLGLEWSRVHLERKLGWVEAADMKGNKAIGIPLSIEAINVLKTVQGQHPEFCFTYRGKPVKEIKTAFMAACLRAGLGESTREGYVGFTWHGLRHTWATWHVQAGTPLEVLQKLGGWSDLRMVMRYAHHSPGFLAQYADNAAMKK